MLLLSVLVVGNYFYRKIISPRDFLSSPARIMQREDAIDRFLFAFSCSVFFFLSAVAVRVCLCAWLFARVAVRARHKEKSRGRPGKEPVAGAAPLPVPASPGVARLSSAPTDTIYLRPTQ